MVTPGSNGVEIGEQLRFEFRRDGLMCEFIWKAGRKILKHREADEKGIARVPGCGLIMQDTELDRQMA